MTPPEDGYCGLTNVLPAPLERQPIRTRGAEYTQAAWSLRVRCAEGEGSIVLVEIAGSESCYRGEGLFLGWSQERLRSVYESSLGGKGGEEPVEVPQLG